MGDRIVSDLAGDMFLITVDRGSPEELDKVHEIAKLNSAFWWHHFSSTWIVAGKTASEWKDLLEGILVGPDSAILILRLPEEEKRNWWLRAREESLDKKASWLHKYYTPGSKK